MVTGSRPMAQGSWLMAKGAGPANGAQERALVPGPRVGLARPWAPGAGPAPRGREP